MPKYTYEEILYRMLDRIPESYDKRESSVIYSALAPAAVELELMYIELDYYMREMYADTASREYLIKRAKERGLKPYAPTNAYFHMTTKPEELEIPMGARFNLEEYNYVVTEKKAPGSYIVQCESEGAMVNSKFGDLVPIEYIKGLESAKLDRLVIPGEDEEDTEDFRKRYFSSFETRAYGGNRQDYIEKTNAIAGVGSTKVTPVWNGGGTVKLTILDSQFNKATPELVDKVQQIIDPTKDGQGFGVAPIGHIVTVETATEKKITVTANYTFDGGYNIENRQSEIDKALTAYYLELRRKWANEKFTIVRIAQIETRLLSIDGIIDIQGTAINGETKNLQLAPNEIPAFG